MRSEIMDINEAKVLIQKTLETQKFGVYNTIRNERPHSALVGFATTPDLSKIIILTPKNTRKFINTQLNQRVNLFISTTTNDPKDLDTAITISVLGTAEVSDKLSTEEKIELRQYYLEKNTHMKQLEDKLEDMIVITVETFELTKNYQKSVVQTSTDMTTLALRQISGIPVVKGLARGRAVNLDSLKEITAEHEKMIVIVNSVNESDSIYSGKIKGLLVVQNTIPLNFEKTLKEENIPTIKGIGDEADKLLSGIDLSINGNLGVVVIHTIK